MRVFLDDRALGQEAATLSEALRAGIDAAKRDGRMIVEVKADGQRISDDALGDPESFNTEVREIRLVSADPLATVGEALTVAGQLLIDARSRQGDAANSFVTGNVGAGAEQLKTVIAAWQSVQDAVGKSAGLLGVDLEQFSFVGNDGTSARARDQIATLAALLNDLLAALARQDWSAGADLLDYDLAAAADSWGAMIRGLSDVVAEKRA